MGGMLLGFRVGISVCRVKGSLLTWTPRIMASWTAVSGGPFCFLRSRSMCIPISHLTDQLEGLGGFDV